jgi:hypothetical protein
MDIVLIYLSQLFDDEPAFDADFRIPAFQYNCQLGERNTHTRECVAKSVAIQRVMECLRYTTVLLIRIMLEVFSAKP